MTHPGPYFMFHADVDECLRPDMCRDGRCINTAGAFRCEYCDSGYRMSRRGYCEGECADQTETCDLGLSNVAGSRARAGRQLPWVLQFFSVLPVTQ